MKIRNLMVAATLLVTAGAMAQNQDCAFFFPNQEGEQITRNCYTADGKLTNILVYRVDQAYEYPSGMEVVANYTFADAAGKTLNSGQMVARCSDGNFSMSMGDVATFPTALNMMNADVYMMGDFSPVVFISFLVKTQSSVIKFVIVSRIHRIRKGIRIIH